MIKDVFKFKKDSWHMRLMKRIWGYEHYHFSNMCPYFWLTVLNVLVIAPTVLPVKWLIKQTRRLSAWIWSFAEVLLDKWEDYCNRRQATFERDVQIKVQLALSSLDVETNDSKVVQGKKYLEAYYNHHYSLTSRYEMPKGLRRALRGVFSHEEGNKIYETFHTKEVARIFKKTPEDQRLQEERKIREARAYERRKKISQAIAKHVVRIKLVFKWLAYGAAALAAYFVFTALYWLASKIAEWRWDTIITSTLTFLIWFIVGFAIVAIIGGFLWGLFKFIKFAWCRYGEYCIPCQERREKLSAYLALPLSAILFPFVNLFPIHSSKIRPGILILPFIWLYQGARFIWEIIVTMKQDNCPALEWED